jgi:hypothetical protein
VYSATCAFLETPVDAYRPVFVDIVFYRCPSDLHWEITLFGICSNLHLIYPHVHLLLHRVELLLIPHWYWLLIYLPINRQKGDCCPLLTNCKLGDTHLLLIRRFFHDLFPVATVCYYAPSIFALFSWYVFAVVDAVDD